MILWVCGRAFGARVRSGAVLAYALLAGPLVEVVVGAFDGGFLGLAVACGLLALAVADRRASGPGGLAR